MNVLHSKARLNVLTVCFLTEPNGNVQYCFVFKRAQYVTNSAGHVAQTGGNSAFVSGLFSSANSFSVFGPESK